MSEPKVVRAGAVRTVLVPCEAESVAVGIFVASGSRHEEAKTAGISHFIEHMLFKGTPTRKPVDITRAIEGHGGNFNAMTGEEATCYFAHLPDEYLGEAVDVLSDMYLNASIAPGEFAREKQVVIEEIKMYADEPDSVVMENLQRNLFPESHLGAPVAGTPASLAPMRPADLKRHIRRHYRADNTVVVIAGHFDEARAVDIVARAFKPLKNGTPPRPSKKPKPSQPIPSKTESKEIHQAHLALGFRTFGIADKRKYAATVMDAILGRGMSSRLFQEVREKRGLSYDISSRMQFFADAGMFTVTAGLDKSKTTLALETIDRELERIRTKKVSAAELKRTKDFLIGNFRLSHEKVTSKLFFYGQTMLSFGRIVTPRDQIDGIRAVTADDVRKVANDILADANRSVSWVVPK